MATATNRARYEGHQRQRQVGDGNVQKQEGSEQQKQEMDEADETGPQGKEGHGRGSEESGSTEADVGQGLRGRKGKLNVTRHWVDVGRTARA